MCLCFWLVFFCFFFSKEVLYLKKFPPVLFLYILLLEVHCQVAGVLSELCVSGFLIFQVFFLVGVGGEPGVLLSPARTPGAFRYMVGLLSEQLLCLLSVLCVLSSFPFSQRAPFVSSCPVLYRNPSHLISGIRAQ